MRVIHIGQAHPVDDIRIVRKECATLAEEGMDTVYITQQKDKAYCGEKICDVSVYTYSTYKMKMYIPFFSVRFSQCISRRRALKLALKLDGSIYHIHELNLWFVAKCLKKKGKKVIFDQHEDSPGQIYQTYLEILHCRLAAAFFKRIAILQEKSIVRSSDLVFTASENIAQNIHMYSLNKNIIVLHNYAHKMATHCDISDYLTRNRIICYAGGLFERRGIKYVIDAMDKVDGVFEFAGILDSKLYQEYAKSNGWKKCKYWGSVCRSEVNRLYERSRVGIINNLDLPYHRNSNPNKLFEYMAAGLPIVCTSIPSWAKIVDEVGCGIVVNAMDATEIASAINYLLDNPKEAQQMGMKGYKAFIDVYNWDTEREKLINAYQEFEREYKRENKRESQNT